MNINLLFIPFLVLFCLSCTNKNTYSFKLTEIQEKSIYHRLGLKSGDVIHKINNQTMSNADQAKQLMQQALTNKLITLTVERDGTEQVIEYKFED